MKFTLPQRRSNAEKVNRAAGVLTCERAYPHLPLDEARGRFEHAAGAQAWRLPRSSPRRCGGEFVVLILPGRFGTHAELGIALQPVGNKRILLWSETRAPFRRHEGFCVFYHHPAVERFVCPV
jgi:hypothetical protein